MKLKLQNVTAESLSLARARRMNRNTRTFFNMLQKVGTENNLSDTHGNIFFFWQKWLTINNKPDSVIAEKGVCKCSCFNTGRKQWKYHRVIACCNAAGQFLLPPSPVIIFEVVNKKQKIGDGLPTGLDVYLYRKSSYISTDLFIKWFKERFLKNKTSRNVILLLDGHRTHCSSHFTASDCCWK